MYLRCLVLFSTPLSLESQWHVFVQSLYIPNVFLMCFLVYSLHPAAFVQCSCGEHTLLKVHIAQCESPNLSIPKAKSPHPCIISFVVPSLKAPAAQSVAHVVLRKDAPGGSFGMAIRGPVEGEPRTGIIVTRCEMCVCILTSPGLDRNYRINPILQRVTPSVARRMVASPTARGKCAPV